MTKGIRTETELVWNLIWQVLLFPWNFIMVLLGRKEHAELLNPLKSIIKFIFEPKLTITLIGVNIAVYVWSFFMSKAVFDNLVDYPANLLQFKFHTLITAGFLHASPSHIIGNMIGLFIFGRVVEKKLGMFKSMIVYFGALIISGVFSSLIHLFVLKDNIGGIGASGALMGLIATAILLAPFHITYELIVPMPIMLVGWLTIYADIVGILNPVEDGIGHFAHIGGFISIALIAFIFGIEDRKKLKLGLLINIFSLILICGFYFLMQYG